MKLSCPVHGTEMEVRGKGAYCSACQSDYRYRAICATCGAELERLQACGASNWFCNQCNELKSKSTVNGAWVRSNDNTDHGLS